MIQTHNLPAVESTSLDNETILTILQLGSDPAVDREVAGCVGVLGS